MTKCNDKIELIIDELNLIPMTFPYEIAENTYSLEMQDNAGNIYEWEGVKDIANNKRIVFSFTPLNLKDNTFLHGYLKENDMSIVEFEFTAKKTI